MSAYRYLIIPLLALIFAQIVKFFIESVKSKKLKWGRLFNGSGGMPSSHTTFAVSLSTAIALGEGITSPLFAICLVFSFIVIYDSMGLRMESGRQATAINQIADEIFEKNPKLGIQHLKEELGHNPLEVLVGILFGITFALLWMPFF